LNDLASSAYYAGGEAEGYIGKTAPWFILAIMLFSYAVRAVYVESCSMFVRGGVTAPSSNLWAEHWQSSAFPR